MRIYFLFFLLGKPFRGSIETTVNQLLRPRDLSPLISDSKREMRRRVYERI